MKHLNNDFESSDFLIFRWNDTEIYLPMAVKTKEMGIDFPVVQAQVSVFEKGIKIMSTKLGCSILFFKDVFNYSIISIFYFYAYIMTEYWINIDTSNMLL